VQKTSRNRLQLEKLLRGLRARVPLLLMVGGALLLLYVAAEYTVMYTEQRRLAQAWEAENVPLAPGVPPVRKTGDGLTRLSIPKIDLDVVVLDGAGNRELRLGPGRIRSTAVPGEAGNSVITAHRDTFFRHIADLRSGDDILVRRAGSVFRYQVTGRRIVEPTDVWVLRQTADSQLTLITCYPIYYIGPAPQRLVIFSKLVDEAGETAAALPAAAAAGAR
jgi:LPXTG-site transpeptidase (sortase) family protein